jgi:hypothetical protein
MRASIALLIAAFPAGLLAACGGEAFQAGTGGDDASTMGFDHAVPPADARSPDAPGAEVSPPHEGGPGPDAPSPPDAAFDGTLDDGPGDDGPGDDGPGDDGPGDDGPGDSAPIMDVLPVPDVAADVVEELPPPPPHCGGEFACVPAPPADWSGPFEFYSGAGAVPACTTNFGHSAFDGNDSISAGSASCGCTCDPAKGVSCSDVSFAIAPTAVCAQNPSGPCDTFTLSNGQCKTINDQGKCNANDLAMTASAPTASGGMCPPKPTFSAPAPSWAVSGRACAAQTAISAADCTSGNVCAPYPSTPFQAGLCIMHTGDVACPTAGYTGKHVLYSGINDARGCSACTCGSVGGATCTAIVKVFSSTTNGTCGGPTPPVPFSLPVKCSAVSQPADFNVTETPSGGTCTPSPVTPVGQVTPAQPTTFCCSSGP